MTTVNTLDDAAEAELPKLIRTYRTSGQNNCR